MPGLRRRGASGRFLELRDRHLLLVPTTTDPLDLDGLVRTWFPRTDLASGRTELPGIGVLTGPHELSMEEAVTAEVPTPWVVAYDLDTPRSRAAPPPPRRPDGLHRAFPAGLPTGGELAGLEFLMAVARRLGGGVRPAGSPEVLVPDLAAAVDLRVVCPLWIRPADVAAILGHEGGASAGVTVAAEGRPLDQPSAHPDGMPFEVSLDLDPAGSVVIHGRVATQLEPAVAGEDYATSPTAVYDVRWHAPEPAWRVADALDGVALACRERVRGRIESVARTLAELGGGVVLDSDGFLVDRYLL
ncbi:MAG: hypothetical protein ACFCVF_17020 [Kineosporiaceae bacterium]